MRSRTFRIAIMFVALAGLATLVIAGSAQESKPMDVVRLKDGGEVRGTIVKRNDKTVWIDLGPTLIAFDLEQIADIETSAATFETDSGQTTLFSVAASPSHFSVAKFRTGLIRTHRNKTPARYSAMALVHIIWG